MLDLVAIKARAAARLADGAAPATKMANPANWLIEAEAPKPISQLAALASNDNQPCSADAWCWPHSDAMNTAELDRMAARLRLFERRGIAEAEADRMADRLMLLERQGSALRACLACYRLTGCAAEGWQCALGRVAAVDRLHRCEGFNGPGGHRFR